jgi:hypothetical protein
MVQRPTGPMPAPNVFDQAAGAYSTALRGPNIGQFFNPFTQNVTNRTMADIGNAQQMAQNQLGAQATQARAFGGSRHGVAEALTNQGFIKQMADTSANMNMQGFNTALGAAQQQQGMMSNLAGQGFGFGQALNQQQMQQGQMQQAIQQALIDAARGQFSGFANAPLQSLSAPLAAVGASNMGQQTQTSSSSPGLLGILGTGASILGGLSGCWVAREVYGEDDWRWVQFRHWLFTSAPKWLHRAYMKHGEAFAGVVRKVPALKRVLRPLMDRARKAAGFEG